MKFLIKIVAIIVPCTIILLLSIIILLICRRRRRQIPSNTTTPFTETGLKYRDDDASFHSSISKLHHSYRSSTSRSSLRFHHLHHNHPQPIQQQQWVSFNWDDHPPLITEAAEYGWSKFTFLGRLTASRSTPLLGLCTVCDGGKQQDPPEIEWELPPGSPEFMQTVRLKSDSTGSSFRMSLPLPGPCLMECSFPQETYFEITVLVLQPQQHRSSRAGWRSKDGEGDRTKLIHENPLAHSPIRDPKSGKEEEGRANNLLISLGLDIGGNSSNRSMPGTYPGSIGFYSNGSVHLDGIKLVFESERAEWAGVNRVIGLGFNPSKKKVILTVDSELVHVISCNSDVYKSPLYPVVAAAKADVMMLVNLGQRAFKYAPANAQRTANPCFVGSSSNGGGEEMGFGDSRELFSMGKIDSEFFDISRSRWKKSMDVDAESDLFEIALHR